ncbi:hypothetical protein SBA3_20024 [Candidatus Sulfopaludibacter sp. SbA3]|nr:hypothetical protein SBA3_20024 [Candidatus Sulfopaludibacter sp. SbA3]
MLGALHNRTHGRGEQIQVESALLAAGALILTLLIILVLFFGVFVIRAS